MGFTVPNGPDAAAVDQAEPDALDYEALGYRSTGVLEGCAVTAQVSPDMSVNVAVGVVVVGGVPVDVVGGNVTIQTSDGNARFDIVAVDSFGTKFSIRGTSSATNPVFPDLDLGIYAFLAAVYVGASTSSISTSAVVDKRIFVERSFQRKYTNDSDYVVSTTSPAGFFRLTADGGMAWVESTLKRISAGVMELASTLIIKSGVNTGSLLTLKARSESPQNQNVLDVKTTGGTTVASIDGVGSLTAANFFSGVGAPTGNDTAPQGSLYVDLTTPRQLALYIHEGQGQWTPFKAYDPSDESIPVGSVMPFIAATVPIGWIALDGTNISTTAAETKDLATLLGSQYGSGPGVVTLPDFRGRIPIGVGGDVALTIGAIAGSASTTLTAANLPSHTHNLADPGHRHPTAGRSLYAPPSGSLRPSTAVDVTPFAIAAEASDADHTSTTGITVQATGDSAPFGILPPVAAVTWIVKAHATYKSLSAVSGTNVVKLDDEGVVTYSTVADIELAMTATATTAELEDVGDDVNTAGKFVGKRAFNTTTSKPVYATTATAGGVWVDATGATSHTPV
jgi:microcystin-dependent protein